MFPELVSNDDDVVFSGDTFFRKEVAAKEELAGAVEHVIEAGSNVLAVHVFELLAAADIEVVVSLGGELLEGVGLGEPVREVAGGDAVQEPLILDQT